MDAAAITTVAVQPPHRRRFGTASVPMIDAANRAVREQQYPSRTCRDEKARRLGHGPQVGADVADIGNVERSTTMQYSSSLV